MNNVIFFIIGLTIIIIVLINIFTKNNGDKSNENEFEFSGDIVGKSKVIIDNNRIIIERKGALSTVSKGFVGTKTIRISQITGTQYKKASVSPGYLQFIIKGSQEVKGGIQAARSDENTVVWGYKNQNFGAEKIINYINDYNQKHDNINLSSNDKYDDLKKLKELLDMNAITKEEYEKKKNEILK